MAVTGQIDTIYQGNRRILRFTVTDEDTSGSPAKDLTGLVVKFALAKIDANGNPIKTNPLLDLNSTAHPTQVIITDAANGIIEVTLLPANTSGLNPTDYYFELEVFDGSGNGVVVATGTLTVNVNVVNA